MASSEADRTPVTPETVQEFLRARSSREKNREIVRDLLRGVGSEEMAAAAAKTGIAAALSGFHDGTGRIDSDPGRYADAFSRLLGAAAERASRPAGTLEWKTADLELLTQPSAG